MLVFEGNVLDLLLAGREIERPVDLQPVDPALHQFGGSAEVDGAPCRSEGTMGHAGAVDPHLALAGPFAPVRRQVSAMTGSTSSKLGGWRKRVPTRN
jgi:hypothetical protein